MGDNSHECFKNLQRIISMNTLEIIFFILLFIVFYTYLGYGILLWIMISIKRLFKKKKVVEDLTDWPDVTLFITAYNEELVVDEKMNNCLELDYPKEKLHIMWVTDGSTDHTNELLHKYPDVKVYFHEARKGKTAAMNHGVKHVKTPFVIFTDANTHLNKEAVKEMVKRFANEKVGCVAGEKRVKATRKDGAASGGEGMYWKYESCLKKWDSELYSTMGAAGELFAIRTKLYEPMPEDTLLDDFIVSMKMTLKGYIIDYCDTAYARELGSANMDEEEKRKVRIAAGGLQSVWRLRELFNVFKYGILSFQFVSHRVLRWSVTPFALFLLFPLNIALLFYRPEFYGALLMMQTAFYLAGIYGYIMAYRSVRTKKVYIPYYFLFMNVNVIKGIIYLNKRKGIKNGAWEKAKRAS